MPKNKSDASAGDTAKKRRSITMENKVEIIKRSEKGETPSSIGRALGYNRSTIATILIKTPISYLLDRYTPGHYLQDR